VKKIVFLLSIFLAILAVGCDEVLLGDQDNVVSLEENLLPPPMLNDGWEVSDPASEGIETDRIHTFIKNLHANHKNIHSVLIIRNNKLVSESYFAGWHRERLHTLRSASKSFISTLTGIAADKGYLTIDQKVFDFFPEYAHLRNSEKEIIEIKHLLTMTSGLKWDEKTYVYDRVRNDELALDASDDRLGYILGKEMESSPGEKFVYNSGGPFLQAEILRRVTGEDIYVYSEKHFFKPLGITNFFWRKERDGQIPAAGPLFLCPRDMAKLGQLFLDGGKWKGTQIVSPEWVSEASATFIGNELSQAGYGYNWWTARETINDQQVRIYMARGNGGQFIFVIPDLNAVVAFTGGNFNAGYGAPSPYDMLTNIIIPAMI
jgi:CubicO group peptidase (beta-lactamase class C family)